MIVGSFNIVLLIPDIIYLESFSAKLLAVMFRTVYTIMAAMMLVWTGKIKSYKTLSFVVTIYELTAVFIFLFIFHQYTSPDYTIQLLGIIIIIIAIFLIPNRWINMIIIAIAAAAGFLLSSYFVIEELNHTQFFAGIIYLIIEIALCAVFAYFYNRYQRGEYLAKTELQRIYATDPLTQIGNRVRLEDEADKWISFCTRHHLPLSLVLIDIDNMKQINDQYGHPIGDVILYEMAQIMHTQLRKNDVCIRWGGDEFILLLPYTNANEAKSFTERIRHEILGHDFNTDINITCSCGIVSMKEEYDLGQLIRQADAAMYMAKKQGKNNIEIYV
ncbi:MAG: GGDEF domain-containing protein [Eubacteriales bacterium]|nr:GGDEF domain-containing protein [Eubacteriales bacterium]